MFKHLYYFVVIFMKGPVGNEVQGLALQLLLTSGDDRFANIVGNRHDHRTIIIYILYSGRTFGVFYFSPVDDFLPLLDSVIRAPETAKSPIVHDH